MALKVWMPLNGNLNQQGCSGCYVTQSTAPTYVAGKTGKAMSTGGFYLPAAEVAKFYNNEAMSFCFWLYPVGSSGNSHIIGQSAMTAGDNRMFTIFQYPTPNDLHLSWQNNDQNNATFFGMSATGFFTANKWTHCTIVYNGSSVKIYRDGSLYNTYSCNKATRTNFSYNVPVPSVSIRYLSDLRIYDHALSEREVKEISKALIAHWKLDDYGPVPNEIVNGMPYGSVSGYSIAGTGWGAATLTANSVSPSGYVVRSTYSGSGGNSGGIHKQPYDYTALENGTVYTFSVWARANKNLAANIYSECMTSKTPTMPVTLTNQWQHFVITGPISNTSQYHSDIIYATGANVTTGDWIEVYGLKLEKGNVATPWCPHTTDSQYTNFAYNPSNIKDSSGFENIGTFSTNKPTVSNNSIRYNSCMLFNGTNNFIMCGRGPMVTDAITVTAWAYMDDWSTHNARVISCTEGGGWNFEPAGSGKIDFAMGTGTSSNTYKSAVSSTVISGSGWHMLTGTYDGLATKIYIDGVLSGTNAAYTTKTPIYYNPSNGIFIGAEAGGTTTTPAGNYFNGKISDVRIYATALSADDIKELYQVSSHICNNGTMMAYSFNEE